MRIGIDIDDTICDTWEYLTPYISKYFNVDESEIKKSNELYSNPLWDFDEYLQFARENYETLTPNIPIKENVKETLEKLKREHKIIFITARSNNGFKDAYKKTYEYLKTNKVPFNKIIVNAHSKEEVCKQEKIDLFIDDNINNCINVSNLGIETLLFKTAYNNNSTLRTVENWKEIYNVILYMTRS